ncbi:MAG: elongation factor 1-beta [Candidatus Nezhaarchaeales archaeon]
MAKVVVLLRILPADVEVDVETLKDKIQSAIAKLGEGFALQSYEVESIAFGLKALRVAIVMPEDVEGGTYILEEAVRNVDGVGEIEVEFVSRIS